MTGTIEKAVAEIKQGRRYPVYLLHGDEFLAKEGAKAIIGALVPPEQQCLSVEVVSEDSNLPSLPIRLNTLPLFGGIKVVVIYDSKAFLSKFNLESVARKSQDAWLAGERERSVRLFLQIVAAAGEGEGFLDRAAAGAIPHIEWERVLSIERDPEAEAWLGGVARSAIADRAPIPEAAGAGLARTYEDSVPRGIPPNAALILTTEVVDERRSLFKRISAAGFVIDCGVRSRRTWDTQMNPEAARAKIRQIVSAAGKSIDEDAMAGILNRAGTTMRGLVSELEKLLLYVGARPAIRTADVLEVFSHSREANIFELTNAVSSRDAGKALLALRGLLTQREPAPLILNVLAGEIRNLIIARSALDRWLDGRLDSAIPFETFRVRVLPRLKEPRQGDDGSAAKLLEMNPFRAFNLLKGAFRFTLDHLLQGLEAIQGTDLSLKTSGHPETLLLEQLLIRVCAGVEAPTFPLTKGQE
jgi:DNA polymerase-3 subunit delta